MFQAFQPTNQVFLSLVFFFSTHPSPLPALTPLHPCFTVFTPWIFSSLSLAFSISLPFLTPIQGGAVVPGLPEVQAGGRLRPFLPGVLGPQPGCSQCSLHLLRWGRPGESRRRRRPGQQWRCLWRHRRLPAAGLLNCTRVRCLCSTRGKLSMMLPDISQLENILFFIILHFSINSALISNSDPLLQIFNMKSSIVYFTQRNV